MLYLIWFIPPIIILVILAYIVVSVRRFSRELLGTANLLQGLKEQKEASSYRPRSLNSMEAVYLPRIKRDFPGLNIEELKKSAEAVLVGIFRALENQDPGLISDLADRELSKKVEGEISQLKKEGSKRIFRDIRIHKSVVSDYKKDQGQVWIILQCALEGYIYSQEASGRIQGEEKLLSQQVYKLYYLYVQDPELVKDRGALGINCPNCGAPIKNLGLKYCDYCGSGIQEVNLRVWRLLDYKLE